MNIPQHGRNERAAKTAVRLVWLTASFMRGRTVSFDEYHERFGRAMRSYRRDITRLREAGLYLDVAQPRGHRLRCFRADLEAA